MEFLSPASIAYLLLIVVLLRVFRSLAHVFYDYIFLLANLGFVGLFFGVQQMTGLLLLVLGGLAVVRWVRSKACGDGAYFATLAAMVALFVVLKRYDFILPDPVLHTVPALIGVSYLMFRLLHLVIEARGREDWQAPGGVDAVNYGLNMFSLVSGPIQRYEQYREARSRSLNDDEGHVLRHLLRLSVGYFKVAILCAVLDQAHQFFRRQSHSFSWAGIDIEGFVRASHIPFGDAILQQLAFFPAALIWLSFLYFNFSGYMDIVIAAARLAGLDLPENFNQPYKARNFLDFWRRWHMTLSGWFRDYVFTPLVKAMTYAWPAGSRTAIPTLVAFFITFALVGIWHGETWPFVVCGLLIGTGASAVHLWQIFLKKTIGRRRAEAWAQRPRYAWAFGLTYAYVAVSISPVWMTTEEFVRFLAAAPALPLAFVVGAMAMAAIGHLAAGAFAVMGGAVDRLGLGHRAASPWAIAALTGIVVNFVVLYALSTYRAAPHFVYQGF